MNLGIFEGLQTHGTNCDTTCMEMLPGNHKDELPLIHFVSLHCSCLLTLFVINSWLWCICFVRSRSIWRPVAKNEVHEGSLWGCRRVRTFRLHWTFRYYLHHFLDQLFILLVLGTDCFVCPLRVIRARNACSSLRY